MITGYVPSSLCNISTLNNLLVTHSDTNPLITCAPLCLTTVNSRALPATVLDSCPSFQDNALCGFIASTDIESKTSYTEWSCNSIGKTNTDPCDPFSSTWTGVTCRGNFIVSISMYNSYLIGKYTTVVP